MFGYHCLSMQKDNKHIDQDQLSTLQEEIADLKSMMSSMQSMMSMMQDVITNQSKHIHDVHKALFNHPKKSKQESRKIRVDDCMATILAKGIIKK